MKVFVPTLFKKLNKKVATYFKVRQCVYQDGRGMGRCVGGEWVRGCASQQATVCCDVRAACDALVDAGTRRVTRQHDGPWVQLQLHTCVGLAICGRPDDYTFQISVWTLR